MGGQGGVVVIEELKFLGKFTQKKIQGGGGLGGVRWGWGRVGWGGSGRVGGSGWGGQGGCELRIEDHKKKIRAGGGGGVGF